MYHKSKQQGFTIIELMFAMMFVAFILVFISLTLVQMLRTYDKGVSMKQVNQAGRSVIDEISHAVSSQLPRNVNTDAVYAGVLCVDDVMYVWNPLYVGPSPIDPRPALHGSVIGDPVSGGMMARKILTNPELGCPGTLAEAMSAPVGKQTQLLSGRTRVLSANAEKIAPRLVKLDMVIGTYDYSDIVRGADNYNTATRQPDGSFSCPAGNSGNYCAFAEFSTLVYLSKDQ